MDNGPNGDGCSAFASVMVFSLTSLAVWIVASKPKSHSG